MLQNAFIALPPLDTQRRIARFLDEKTVRIDGLIEKKRELVDRLAEKRQALITRAVTKGLNPDAPMKPSGIEWLGDIPAHWELMPLKRVLAKPTGFQLPWSLLERLLCSAWESCRRNQTSVICAFLDEIDEDLLLDINDVVFNRTNSLALVRGFDFPQSSKPKLSQGHVASYLVRSSGSPSAITRNTPTTSWAHRCSVVWTHSRFAEHWPSQP